MTATKASVKASGMWLTNSLNYIYPNPNPNPMKRNNQPLYGKTPFVSYTVCVNHVAEKVCSSTGGTIVVYNTNISVGAVVEAAEIPWKLRKLPWK